MTRWELKKELFHLQGELVTPASSLENLRQQQDKNTAALGTTALPTKGARRKRRKKKPSAEKASQDQLDKRSLEQKGQKPAATHLRNLEKLRLIKEIELAAENQPSLSNLERQEISLRILLTLSLRNKWQLTTTRATEACSEDALGRHLRNIGLDQNKMDQNIFSGDELVILVHKRDILIGGTELQQEELFCELSALVSLDQIQKLDPDTQVSFCNRTLEYQESSHSISLSLGTCFVRELLCRHELEDAEPLGSLDEEKPCQDALEQTFALDAGRQELYKHTVGNLFGQQQLAAQTYALRCIFSPKAWKTQPQSRNSSFTECLDTLLELCTIP